jgi:hypothetical protein
MARTTVAPGVRVAVLGTSRQVLIKPSDKRYKMVVDAITGGEDVCLVKVGRRMHLFVYSQTEVNALADIPRRK